MSDISSITTCLVLGLFFAASGLIFCLFIYAFLKNNDRYPDDQRYLKRLSSKMLAVPFKEGDYNCYALSIKGRKISLRYFHDTNPKILKISFAVVQKFWLRITPQAGENLPDELQIEDQSLDAKFRIHSDEQEIALRFLNTPIIAKELRHLHPFNCLEIYRGNATYVLHNPRDRSFGHLAFEKTLERLNTILDVYDLQQLELYVEHLKSEPGICPYCRGDLDDQKEVILKCNLCRTAHHESCLRENRQCTTWGCFATEKDFSMMMDGTKTASNEQFETN